MPANQSIRTGVLRANEAGEAARIMRVAFGTFLGFANPEEFMGDRDFLTPRFQAPHVRCLAARDGSTLVGTNVLTRWGSFAYFGPLTVLPEYWNRGVAQQLLRATMKVFDGWKVRASGLYTFSNSAKHVALYQKFGYWPQYLTSLLTLPVESIARSRPGVTLSQLDAKERERTIGECARLTSGIQRGLDLSSEIRTVLARGTGDVVVAAGKDGVEGFAVCAQGAGTEGGAKTCYVKFGAARAGAGAGRRFEKLLDAVEAFARQRGVAVEAGVNLAREDAFRRMRARGYRIMGQGVSMQRPHAPGFNRPDAYVIDDWR